MFKNRSMQVKLIKDSDLQDPAFPSPHASLVQLDILLETHLKSVVGGVVTIMVARKLLDTACELILIKAGK